MQRAVPFLVLALSLLGASVVGATDVPATIDIDTTWTAADSPYVIAADATVAEGVTLTIEAGVEVRLAAGQSLLVAGALIARGTEVAPIHFDGVEDAGEPVAWGSVVFEASSADAEYAGLGEYAAGSLVEGVEFRRAAHALELRGASPLIRGCTFKDNTFAVDGESIGGAAILVRADSTARIVDNEFIDNLADDVAQGGAIYVDFADPIIQDNLFRGNYSAYGGALATAMMASPIVGNTFEDNTTRSEGGGMSLLSTVSTVCNNHVARNYATLDGGGIHVCVTCFPHATPFFFDNTIIDNTNDFHGAAGFGAAYLRAFRDNNLHGNTTMGSPSDFGWHNEDREEYPDRIVNPDIAHNWWGTTDTAAIAATIHDGADEDGYGRVSFEPVLTAAVAIPETRVTITTRKIHYDIDNERMPVFLTLYNPGAEREVVLEVLLDFDGLQVPYRGTLDVPGATPTGNGFQLTLPANGVYWSKLIEPNFQDPGGLDHGFWHAAIFDASTGERIGEASTIRFHLGAGGAR